MLNPDLAERIRAIFLHQEPRVTVVEAAATDRDFAAVFLGGGGTAIYANATGDVEVNVVSQYAVISARQAVTFSVSIDPADGERLVHVAACGHSSTPRTGA